jgi:hypothetical protein
MLVPQKMMKRSLAFSRTGDLSSGDFEDAVVLKQFGQVPDDLTFG